MTIRDLIARLKTKDTNKPVQFLVIGNDGEVVCMNLEAHAVDIEKMLKCFKKPTKS